MFKPRLVAALLAATVAGCEKPPPAPPQPRPVRTVTIERHAEGQLMALTGQVRAKDEASLAFRLDGRMIARLANVGVGPRRRRPDERPADPDAHRVHQDDPDPTGELRRGRRGRVR